MANLPLSPHQPYVGRNAFRHKGGLHASGFRENPGSYQHIDPDTVGNAASVAVSEQSGKSNVVAKAKELGVSLNPEQIKRVLAEVKTLENQGFQFEDADGSLKIIMVRYMDGYHRSFEVLKREVSSRRFGKEKPVDSATVKLCINNSEKGISHEVADGDGPVNALDNALRKALLPHFTFLGKVKLEDYKVRVLPGKKGTAKTVRVRIDFSDGQEEWTTVGCSTDLIEASLQALLDGFEYAILKAQ